MPTRRDDLSLVEQVDSPEGILRQGGWKSMAAQQNDGNIVPGNQDPAPRRDDTLWDGNRYMGPIPNFFVPDLNNTPLREAVERGMALNDNGTEYMIICPALKRFRQAESGDSIWKT